MRIIAGIAKGRTLRTLRGYGVRPTPEKVRESLFHRLGNLEGLRFLDGFAGSGAVGIEALSRGASRSVFVESDQRACRCVRENLERAGFAGQKGWKIQQMASRPGFPSGGVVGYYEDEGKSWAVLPITMTRAIAYLERAGEAFDLIFIDPPYRSEAGLVTLKRLAGSPLLASGSRLIWEHAAGELVEMAEAAGWRIVDTRRFGDTGITELTRPD